MEEAKALEAAKKAEAELMSSYAASANGNGSGGVAKKTAAAPVKDAFEEIKVCVGGGARGGVARGPQCGARRVCVWVGDGGRTHRGVV
eukprot:336602-Chlamydomonas_euryale.AAC.1